MKSTGVYWIPVYEILEQRGFEVMLVKRDALLVFLHEVLLSDLIPGRGQRSKAFVKT